MRLNGIFKDNIVFQRGGEIRVFGTASSGTEIKSCIKNGTEVLTQAHDVSNGDGSFLVLMPALDAGGPFTLEVSSSEESVVINNVYIGEVWLAGGQSNMEYPLGRSAGASEVVPSCPKTRIHFYNVPVFDTVGEELLEAEDETSWDVIDSSTCYGMTGVGYYFMLEVQRFLETHAEGCEDLHFGLIGS